MENHRTGNADGRGLLLFLILAVGLLAILASIIISLLYGTKNLQLPILWEAIFNYNTETASHQIIHDIRLPRALAAAMIGAFLAISGAIMQALTRNPLAEPSLLGISYGAAFALVVSMAIIENISRTGATAAAMIGAGLTAVLVFGLAAASKGVMTPVKLALAGVGIGMFLSSFTSIIALYSNTSKDISFWYAGGLAAIDWSSVKMLAVTGFIGILIVPLLARPLTLLSLGADVTKGLGINLNIVRTLSVLAVLLLTGSSVASSGAIGFVGLVVPHISRMLIGADYRCLLPVSAVLGSLLLILADVGTRMINPPFETPVGVLTALIGVPFFLYLVRSERSQTS
ncbi:ferrichrome ABC transporter permease [Bacillus sp. M6-12]|uniref:FecCD family ABC transporter permease n=1 Tax=Bacillus sp. M6-12 TaxID=2054166 RepID=UPI000C77E6C0|nr:ferrichrome ABC transporter permease [Bacillus sp. M6-12]